jgi:hypothetical protein
LTKCLVRQETKPRRDRPWYAAFQSISQTTNLGRTITLIVVFFRPQCLCGVSVRRQHYVRFDLISSTPEEWYTDIIPPFWNLPADNRARATLVALKERAMSFRSNLLDIMVVKFHHNFAEKGLSNRSFQPGDKIHAGQWNG